MRTTYRYTHNKDYWRQRWTNTPVDEPMKNMDVYPLRYAEMMIQGDKKGRILEAGCGNGRILRYYHQMGYDIAGIDFISDAIDRLKEKDVHLQAFTEDITQLSFADQSFKYVLAFGLYHNFTMDKMKEAIAETYRVIQSNGKVCASFRADNIQNWLNDKMAERRQKNGGGDNRGTAKQFHKMNLKKNEFTRLFHKAGFEIETVMPIENMPLFYKFTFFRHKSHKKFNEKLGRSDGYRLSPLGSFLQALLVKLFPDQFCNIYILIARKPENDAGEQNVQEGREKTAV